MTELDTHGCCYPDGHLSRKRKPGGCCCNWSVLVGIRYFICHLLGLYHHQLTSTTLGWWLPNPHLQHQCDRFPNCLMNPSLISLPRWPTITSNSNCLNLSSLYQPLLCVLSHSVVSASWWPMDYSPPRSSVHGISQARILDCVAISSSRGFSQSRTQTCISWHLLHWQAGSLLLSHLGSPSTTALTPKACFPSWLLS